MAEWIEPKTDWRETDKFLAEDYNRIKNNIYYLWEKACEAFPRFSIQDMGEDMEEESIWWDVFKFNAFEENLESINFHTFFQDIGMRQTFYVNGVFIKWDELNRIESMSLKMKKVIEAAEDSRFRLAFRLGLPRSLQF